MQIFTDGLHNAQQSRAIRTSGAVTQADTLVKFKGLKTPLQVDVEPSKAAPLIIDQAWEAQYYLLLSAPSKQTLYLPSYKPQPVRHKHSFPPTVEA